MGIHELSPNEFLIGLGASAAIAVVLFLVIVHLTEKM